MDPKLIPALISRYGLISDQVDANELSVILRYLITAISANNGAVVEFGCYRGTTSLYIRRVLDIFKETRPFHVYDSFAGLPAKTVQDQSPAGLQFVEGELMVSKKDFLGEFKKAHLRPPIVHKGWFSELDSDDIPESIGFAFLDGDYYDSIKTPLSLIEDRLVPGAIIIIDDYVNEALPGAARAVDGWARRHNKVVTTTASLGIIHC